MKKHIFLYITSILIIFAVVSGILMFKISTNVYQRTMQSNLMDTMRMAKSTKIDDPELIVNYFKNTLDSELRITLIDNNGKAISDSYYNSSEMENHANRIEIIQAMKGNNGSDIRKSATDGRKYMYLATRYDDEKILRLSIPYNEYDALVHWFYYWIIAGVIVITFVSTLISLLLSHWIVKPINNFNETISRFASGDYSVRAEPQKIKELKPLATNFNQMATSLITTISELRDKNTEINNIIENMSEGFIAINERHHITLINPKALEYLNANYNKPLNRNIFALSHDADFINTITDTLDTGESNILDMDIDGRCIRMFTGAAYNGGLVLFLQDVTLLKDVERMRAEFTANVSHELKTPLTSIKGFAETLKDGALENMAVAYNFLDIISIEAERLSILINDILQISEIESMKIDVNIMPHKIKSSVLEVKDLLSDRAREQNIAIHINCNDDIVINANPDRIKQLFLNLVDNSLKYGVQNGNVWIDIDKEYDKLRISIKDDGMGIEQEDLPRIFERFYRTEKSRSKKNGGTGLGLAIVKHIVNLYKGTIDVTSDYGEGAEFKITLIV